MAAESSLAGMLPQNSALQPISIARRLIWIHLWQDAKDRCHTTDVHVLTAAEQDLNGDIRVFVPCPERTWHRKRSTMSSASTRIWTRCCGVCSAHRWSATSDLCVRRVHWTLLGLVCTDASATCVLVKS